MSENLFGTIRFQTPAKINTYLFVQNKRPDGYHELTMDLIPVSFFDTIEITEIKKGNFELVSNLKEVPIEDNLVTKAVRLLEKETGLQFSLRIRLTKNIPTGAGLGGGSGNAAGILSVLNSWYNLDLSDTNLREIALKLGADVPFFINPRPSLAKGIGEQLTELPEFKPLHLILIYPGFPISTEAAYANCRISARNQLVHPYTPDSFSTFQPEMNDFWPWLKKEYPEISACRQSLADNNAVFSGVSGSGSTVFGIFRNQTECEIAFKNLKSVNTGTVVKCSSLTGFIYLPLS